MKSGVVTSFSRLARIRELLREAGERLKWFDYYNSHSRNARLTCRYFGISPQTFYRWKRRYDHTVLWDIDTSSRGYNGCDYDLKGGIAIGVRSLGVTGFAAVWALIAGYRPWLLLGKAEEALQLITTSVPFPYAEALCLAHLGRDTEVVEILERFVVTRPGIGSAEDETSSWEDILYLEAAVLVGQRRAAELLLSRFAGSFSPLVSYIALTCTACHLGAAAFLGRPDEARNYYQEALKVATEVRFRPEVALIRLQLAELLLEHYPDEKAEAREHLDFAINEFQEMKMQPSLERALRHKDILKA